GREHLGEVTLVIEAGVRLVTVVVEGAISQCDHDRVARPFEDVIGQFRALRLTEDFRDWYNDERDALYHGPLQNAPAREDAAPLLGDPPDLDQFAVPVRHHCVYLCCPSSAQSNHCASLVNPRALRESPLGNSRNHYSVTP